MKRSNPWIGLTGTPAACGGVVILTALIGCESGHSAPPDRAAAREVPIVIAAPIEATTRTTTQGTPASANVTRVTFAEEGCDFDPAVSRDGERLVFASTQHRAASDIYVKRTNSKVLTRLTSDPAEDAMPAISPDGQRVAFASNRAGNWDVFIMPITGGKAVQITDDPSDDLNPSWSPDGTQLVFCRLGQASARWEMWVTDTTGSEASNFIGYGMFPKWCPATGTGAGASDRILFQLGRERGRRTFGVWTLDYKNGTAGNLTEIASSADAALINPSWSPDGNWVAYAEVPVGDEAAAGVIEPMTPGYTKFADGTARDRWTLPRGASLWMMNIDGTGRVNLASGGGSTVMPVWGGSNKLYFVSDRGGKENVWSLDLGEAMLAATAGRVPTEHVAGAAETTSPAGEK